jgi:hypothetical protein
VLHCLKLIEKYKWFNRQLTVRQFVLFKLCCIVSSWLKSTSGLIDNWRFVNSSYSIVLHCLKLIEKYKWFNRQLTVRQFVLFKLCCIVSSWLKSTSGLIDNWRFVNSSYSIVLHCLKLIEKYKWFNRQLTVRQFVLFNCVALSQVDWKVQVV